MDEEISSTEKKMKHGSRPIGVKWVYKKKTNVNVKVERYKARFMVTNYK